VDPLALTGLVLAHGGIPGAIAEASVAIVVIALFGSIWMRERSARRSRDRNGTTRRDD
jgi:hypothetical protein